MQINRLFEIVYILLDKKTVTAGELAGHFEVSARTIYRDVDSLCQAGIPIYMSQGRGGGISLLPEFVLNKALLTEEEKRDILASLWAVNAVEFQKTNTALRKLGSLFGEKNADWIEVDFSVWTDGEKEACLFQTLKSAILEKKVITFLYSSAKQENTNREVEPLKLCFKGSSWYLYGYCRMRGECRFFKLRRMQDPVMAEEFFQRGIPERILVGTEQYQQEYISLTLRLDPEMAFRVYDEFDHYRQQQDGSFLVECRCAEGEWLLGYIASFGSFCEVLQPRKVRERVKKELENILKNYL